MTKRSFILTDEQKMLVKGESLRMEMLDCYFKKCSKEKEMFVKQMAKFESDINNARLLFFNNKIKEPQFRKKILTIKQKIDKTVEKHNAVQCQLNKCYTKTKQSVLHFIDHHLKHVDKKKDLKKYKFLMKYKNLFTEKMTVKDGIKFDQDLIYYGFTTF